MDDTPSKNKRYLDFIDRTPVKKSKREKLKQNGIFLSPKYNTALSNDQKQDGQQEEECFNYENVADEIWIKILGYLQIDDLINMGAVNKKFNVLHNDNWIWKRLYAELFFGPPIHLWNLNTYYCFLERNNITRELQCGMQSHFIKRNDGEIPVENLSDYKKATIKRIFSLFKRNILTNLVKIEKPMLMDPFKRIESKRNQNKINILKNQLSRLKRKYQYWLN